MDEAVDVEVIEIPADIRDAMVQHAIAELPNEACGLFAGANGRVERFYPMANADHSPKTYQLEPNEQFKVFAQIDRDGWEWSGIFHSHTESEAYPSPTDQRQAFYPEALYLLVSLQDHDHPVFRGFTMRDGKVQEHDVVIR